MYIRINYVEYSVLIRSALAVMTTYLSPPYPVPGTRQESALPNLRHSPTRRIINHVAEAP